MPMSPRLLRPRATGFHPEAQGWRNRVIANGGTVSGSTLTAVSNFCRSIEAAGLRDRFFRLNLFCGTGLSAALVPLYRGQSPSGTQYGNTTDTNNNFVSGDYVETGSTGGLKGNGSTKAINTGLALSALPSLATGHVAAWKGAGSFTGNGRALVAARTDASGTSLFRAFKLSTGGADAMNGIFGKQVQVNAAPSTVNDAGLQVTDRSSSTRLDLYWRGSSVASSTTSAVPDSSSNQYFIFHDENGGADYWPLTIAGYSIGSTMTASQHAAYYTAMLQFQTALSRQSA